MKEKHSKPFPLSPTIGTIQDHKIIGREHEIISVLRLLKGQSVSVEEIRRMGKTLLVQKLAYYCNEDLLSEEFAEDNFKAKYFTFQGQQNLGILIDYLIRELEQEKEWYKIDLVKTYNILGKILNTPKFSAFGAEITLNLPEYKKHWKDIFFKILEDIAENLEKENTKLILIFDELPIMLWDWYTQGREKEAIELLDILRERRQVLEKKGLRFIYCGSVGMNIVLDTLRSEFGYTGEATNEMEEYNVGAFELEEVKFLCECYTLSGFTTDEKDKEELWKTIYKYSNGIPYYASKMFNVIQTECNKVITKENIEFAYEELLNNPKNHKAFKQLLERINVYYSKPPARGEALKTLLSFLAKQNKFISEEKIMTSLKLEKDEITRGLYTLYADHYLVRAVKAGKRQYKFKYEIFKQWWKINIA